MEFFLQVGVTAELDSVALCERGQIAYPWKASAAAAAKCLKLAHFSIQKHLLAFSHPP